MADRFDLEQQIMNCWNVTDDIKLLNRRVLDTDTMDKDEVANFLIGLAAIYNAKFEEMFEVFGKLVQDGKIT